MWKTIGHSKIVGLLQQSLGRGTLSHAYLLIGPPQVGKMTLARDLAATLNCRSGKGNQPCWECSSCLKIAADKHADVQVIGLNSNLNAEEAREKTEIGIGQIEYMLHSANLPPFEGLCRVYIIDEAANLSTDAANRLLKTLEEPPARVIFVLLTASPGLIPATVLSRCQQLNLARLKTGEIESLLISRGDTDPETAKLISRLSRGCPGWAIAASHNTAVLPERREKFEKMRAILKADYNERFTAAAQLALQFSKKRESVYETLDIWTGWWRDLLLVKTGCNGAVVSTDFMPAVVEMAGTYSLAQIKDVINYVLEAGEHLKLNANPRLVLESLMLKLPQPSVNTLTQQIEVKHA
jgi:DNA polymerase III subunit delta'